MKTKPKVAVLLFGQPRYINASYKHLAKEFCHEDGTPFDIFAHFWKETGFSPKGDAARQTADYTSEICTAQQHLNIKELKVQDYRELDDYVIYIENVIRLLTKHHFKRWVGDYNEQLINKRYKWGQHLSLLKAYNLLNDYENKFLLGVPSKNREPQRYDTIIKARTDFVYKTIECYEKEEEYYKEKADNYLNFDIFDRPAIKTSGLEFQKYNKKLKQWEHNPLKYAGEADFRVDDLFSAQNILKWEQNENNIFRIGDISLSANRIAAPFFFAEHLNTYLYSFLHSFYDQESYERVPHLRPYDRHDAVQGSIAYYNKVNVKKVPCRYFRLARSWDCKKSWKNTKKNNSIVFSTIEDETCEFIANKILQIKGKKPAEFG